MIAVNSVSNRSVLFSSPAPSKGKTFPTISPVTGKEIVQVSEGFKEDIDLAVQAAVRVFHRKSPWRLLSASKRGRLLSRLADLVERDIAYIAVSVHLFSLVHRSGKYICRAASFPRTRKTLPNTQRAPGERLPWELLLSDRLLSRSREFFVWVLHNDSSGKRLFGLRCYQAAFSAWFKHFRSKAPTVLLR